MATPNEIVASLRSAIKDINFWGESETDSPLKIAKTWSAPDLIKSDSRLRLKAQVNVPLGRTVTTKTLAEVFNPLIDSALQSALSSVVDGNYTAVESKIETLEYYLQLNSIFSSLTNPIVSYVEE